MNNRYNILKTTQNGQLYDPNDWTKKTQYSSKQKTKYEWIKLLSKENYKTLVTIQAPMKNKYKFDSRMEDFFRLRRVSSLFYSVEQNTDKLGYHIHLMFNAYYCNKYDLRFTLDTPLTTIPYYENIDNNSKVASYVNKKMNGDQIHYNFFKK